MHRTMISLLVLAALASAAPLAAQGSVDPGMSRAAVVEALGQPVVERKAGDFDYLFYHNDCEHRCGMMDLVIIQNDQVIDAVFRGSAHHYSGASSSPTESAATPTRAAAPSTASPSAGAKGGLIIGNRTPPSKKGEPGIVIHSVKRGAAASAPDSTATPATVDPNADTTNTKRPHQDINRDTTNTKRPATDPNADTSHVKHGPPARPTVPADSTRKP